MKYYKEGFKKGFFYYDFLYFKICFLIIKTNFFIYIFFENYFIIFERNIEKVI